MKLKSFIASVLRKSYLLPAVSMVLTFPNILTYHFKNKTYLKTHDIKIPPYLLMLDAYGHCNAESYHETGLLHSKAISDVILKYKPNEKITVCEWGCGSARLIQHLKSYNPNIVKLIGTDYNSHTISWCKTNFDNIDFIHNELEPPLDLPDNSVDVLYCLSVFTHLSEKQHYNWIKEIKRVLKPNGLLIASLHGEKTFSRLFPHELESAKNGNLVTRGQVKEGSGLYIAYHSDNFVKNKLLCGFKDIDKIECSFMLQDIWCAVK